VVVPFDGERQRVCSSDKTISSRVIKSKVTSTCTLQQDRSGRVAHQKVPGVPLNSLACFADACWYRASRDANCLVALGQKGQRVAGATAIFLC
jgi:hypothetical protein